MKDIDAIIQEIEQCESINDILNISFYVDKNLNSLRKWKSIIVEYLELKTKMIAIKERIVLLKLIVKKHEPNT